MAVARTYIRDCKCKPDAISEPLTYITKCESCEKDMVEGDDYQIKDKFD